MVDRSSRGAALPLHRRFHSFGGQSNNSDASIPVGEANLKALHPRREYRTSLLNGFLALQEAPLLDRSSMTYRKMTARQTIFHVVDDVVFQMSAST